MVWQDGGEVREGNGDAGDKGEVHCICTKYVLDETESTNKILKCRFRPCYTQFQSLTNASKLPHEPKFPSLRILIIEVEAELHYIRVSSMN